MQTSGRGFYGFGAKEEDKMEELEEPRGATFLWLLPHRIAPESGNPGASLREPEPCTRLGGLQQKPVLEPYWSPVKQSLKI